MHSQGPAGIDARKESQPSSSAAVAVCHPSHRPANKEEAHQAVALVATPVALGLVVVLVVETAVEPVAVKLVVVDLVGV